MEPRVCWAVVLTSQCPTPQHLQAELDTLTRVLDPGETEENWDKMEKAIIRFTAVVRGGAYKHHDLFMMGVGKVNGHKISSCVSRWVVYQLILPDIVRPRKTVRRRH